MKLKYTFTLEPDPEFGDEGFQSIFIDNGHGCSAEVVGKIGSQMLGKAILGTLSILPQATIRKMFVIPETVEDRWSKAKKQWVRP